MGIRIGV